MVYNYKGIDVFYKDFGEGDVSVFLHGYMEEHSIWDELCKKIAHKNRCIIIDLFGHGKTQSFAYVHTMEEMALMVTNLIDYLGIKQYKVFGHSMGGYVALAMIEITTPKMTHICLINSTPHPDSLDRINNRNRAILAIKKSKDVFISMAVSNLVSFESRTLFENEINKIKLKASSTTLQGVIAAQEGMKLRKSRLDTLLAFKGEKLVVLGTNDPVLNVLDVAKGIPKNEIDIKILKGGHMLFVENKSDLTKEVVYFIDK